MINFYGIIISFSILICILFAEKLIDKKNEDTLWGISLWAIIFGVIGARIYHVIDYWNFYGENILEIFKIWKGGLGIWGALIGGFLGISVYVKNKKGNLLYWLDLISVVMPLGQAVGRWGNFFNKEIVGLPTNLPWGMSVNLENRPGGYEIFSNFHPLFIYESVLNTILFLFLYKLYKKFHKKITGGIFMSLYLGSYSIIRFFLENLRINPWEIYLKSGAVLNVSQCISILVLGFSIIFVKIRMKNDIHFFRS